MDARAAALALPPPIIFVWSFFIPPGISHGWVGGWWLESFSLRGPLGGEEATSTANALLVLCPSTLHVPHHHHHHHHHHRHLFLLPACASSSSSFPWRDVPKAGETGPQGRRPARMRCRGGRSFPLHDTLGHGQCPRPASHCHVGHLPGCVGQRLDLLLCIKAPHAESCLITHAAIIPIIITHHTQRELSPPLFGGETTRRERQTNKRRASSTQLSLRVSPWPRARAFPPSPTPLTLYPFFPPIHHGGHQQEIRH